MNLKGVFQHDIEIKNICIDSRHVIEGSLFVCIVGANIDGHKFALSAEERGAAAILAEHELPQVRIPVIIVPDTKEALATVTANFYGNPADKLKLIGVTGTNGKTTVTYIVKNILEACGKKVGLIGTNNNMIMQEVVHAERTTPDALELHELFKRMLDSGCEYVIMEVSSHALDRKRVFGCHFEVGAFTNLTGDHLDYHDTMQNYLLAKMKLFDNSDKKLINFDDQSGQIIAKKYDVIKYGIDSGDLRAKDIKLLNDRVEFKCCYDEEEHYMCLGIPGKFSVYNALTAIGICLNLGISLEKISQGLATARGVVGRIEVVETGKDFTVLIDYAHTPDGLRNVLETVRGFCQGRLIVVFGCGGDRDRTKRPLMGSIASDLADFVIITTDNPRTEEPIEIIKDIELGMGDGEYRLIENRRDAIKYALDYAKKNDIIILAGKGHETYQILKDKTIHFDEREVIAEFTG